MPSEKAQIRRSKRYRKAYLVICYKKGFKMNKEERTRIEDLLKGLTDNLHLRIDEIPDLDLYMDQVLTLINAHLSHDRSLGEKALTKTMINNYTKQGLLPSPEKKKYSKNHIIILVFIYYFKSFLSLEEIQALLTPLTDKYFSGEGSFSLPRIYEEILQLEEEQTQRLIQNIMTSLDEAGNCFGQNQEDSMVELKRFALICLLSYDVYMKKALIEAVFHDLYSEEKEEKTQAAKSRSRKKKSSPS